jgi:uncharacterized protein (TIGR02266 family)
MSQERRSHRRARFKGMRVTYEDAAGRRVETEALDISAGGLFVLAREVIPVGKRLSVDVTLPGGSSKWSALVRVIWVRERSGDAGPAGMGMKLIDADDNMIAAIRKLVASREATDPGTGGSKTPSRERTVMGVGTSDEQGVPAAPIVTAAPARERTVLGIGSAMGVAPGVKPAPAPSVAVAPEMSIPIELVAARKTEGAQMGESELPTRRVSVPRIEREPSELNWDLVPKGEPEPEPRPEPKPEPRLEAQAAEVKPAAVRPAAAKPAAAKPAAVMPAAVEPPPSEASLAEAGVPRRRGGTWIALLLLLAIGGAGYAFRSRIMLAVFPPPAPPQAVQATPAPEPPSATVSVAPSVTSAAPPPSVAPSASVAPRASASASTSASASAGTRASASASTSASAKPRTPPAPSSSASAAPRRPSTPSPDNPY